MYIEAVMDAVTDSIKLLPFLFVTYLLMELIEYRTSDQTKQMLRKSGKFGPLMGGLFGAVPQCGFSAAASNLYAGRVITAGTLIAVFLSTSDEMLPIFISESVEIEIIIKILFIKMMIGIVAGVIIDYVVHKKEIWREIKRKGDAHKNDPFHIHDICEQEHCGCKTGGIWKSTIVHTLQIWLFILIISVMLDVFIARIGTEGLKHFIFNAPYLGVILAGIVGLIPNCAASVVLTQLYLEGGMSFGALMSGLLIGAGVGLLVLFRVNKRLVENLKMVFLLYLIGVVSGLLIELLNIKAWIAI